MKRILTILNAGRTVLAKRWVAATGFWRRNYVWLVTLIAAALAALALVLWLRHLPFLAGDLAALLSRALESSRAPADDFADLRNIAYALAAILGATAIVATIPFQLIKTWVNERLATATEEGLITDRIAKAVEQLGAEKTAKLRVRTIRYKIAAGDRADVVEVEEVEGAIAQIPSDVADDDIDRPGWESIERQVPNIEVRLGGIYALERISQDSARDHIQIMEILCAYIRHNALASAAKGGEPDLPEDGIPTVEWSEALGKWVRDLEAPRADVQAALTVIGRRSEERIAQEVGKDPKNPAYRLDLRNTNLQRADLVGARLAHAQLTEAQMQGAFLWEAQMQEADLGLAQMQGAHLEWAQMQGAALHDAQMQGADLEGAQMQGARLRLAHMQGADLERAQMQGADLDGAQMQGANLWRAQMQGARLYRAQMQGADLEGAQMQGAHLPGAQMQGADLEWAQMQGADLSWAQMQGADLSWASFDQSTDLRHAGFEASRLREVDFTKVTIGVGNLKDRLAQAFGDGSVKVPEAWGWDSYATGRPKHWSLESLDYSEFDKRWRAWKKEIGYRGDNPD